MVFKSSVLRPMALAALLVVSGATHATLTVYTTQASFLGAVGASAVDTFNDLALGFAPGPLARTAGAFSYTASAKTEDNFDSVFFQVGTAPDIWVSTDQSSDSIVFNNFSPTVRGVGGLFFGADFDGRFLTGQTVTLVATDSSGATLTQVVTNATTTSFVGFTSNTSLTSLKLTSTTVGTGSFAWPTANNMTLATAAVVPEPGTYAMLLAGLGAVGFMARRRA